MFKDDISPGLLPDPVRRRLLRAGAGALALPLLQACGGSGGGDGSTPGPDPTPPPPQPVGTHPPRGLHVSFSDDPYSTRTLTWFTDSSDAPASAVEYGPVEPDMDEAEIAGAAFPMRAEASAEAVYDVDALCQSAVAGGISSERPLRYRVGSDEGGWSPTYVLAPTPAADAGFRFCHYGDQSTSEAAQAVTAAVSERAPDFLMIVGDLSYANGEQSVWDTYFDMLEPLAARIPVMTTPGNHEAKDGGGDGYDSRIRQPGQNFYYGFDYGRVHFFCSTAGCLLDGVISAASLATELLAMEADLAQAAQAGRRAVELATPGKLRRHIRLQRTPRGRCPRHHEADHRSRSLRRHIRLQRTPCGRCPRQHEADHRSRSRLSLLRSTAHTL